jgi:hypothetical protein
VTPRWDSEWRIDDRHDGGRLLGRKLPLDVGRVVLDLVQRMHRHPAERALGGSWIVVDNGPVPVADVEPRQHVGEEPGSISKLACYIFRILLRVPVVVDALFAPHRVKCRDFPSAGQEHPLSLNEENVSHMAGVLERRPNRRLPPRPDVRAGTGQEMTQSRRAFDHRHSRSARCGYLVDEPALGASLHTA